MTLDQDIDAVRAGLENQARGTAPAHAALDRIQTHLREAEETLANISMERDMANSENERLRVLVMDGRCSYCHRGLFESSGPPCQHLKHLEALSDLPEQEGS